VAFDWVAQPIGEWTFLGEVARVVPVAKHPNQSQPGSNRVEDLPSKQDSLNVNMAMPPPRTVTISDDNDDDDDDEF
jgi:hypothetical protein